MFLLLVVGAVPAVADSPSAPRTATAGDGGSGVCGSGDGGSGVGGSGDGGSGDGGSGDGELVLYSGRLLSLRVRGRSGLVGAPSGLVGATTARSSP